MSAKYKGSLNGTHQTIQKVLLYNSLTFELEDWIETYTYGYGSPAVKNVAVLGNIIGFCDKDGVPLETGGNTPGTAKSPSVTSVTTAANNTTTQTYWALVDINPMSVYSMSVSGTLGTTVSSNLRGCRINVNSDGSDPKELLETTATRTLATDCNFYSHGLDPADSTKLLVSVSMSELNPTSP